MEKYVPVPTVVCTIWPIILNPSPGQESSREAQEPACHFGVVSTRGKFHGWALESNQKQQLLIDCELDENPCSQSTGCPSQSGLPETSKTSCKWY